MVEDIINNQWVCSRCNKRNGVRKSKTDWQEDNILRKCKCGRSHSLKVKRSFNKLIILSHYNNIRNGRGTANKYNYE